nr:MAG TPA: hypothetical protein [Caudoviricetes sp.]
MASLFLTYPVKIHSMKISPFIFKKVHFTELGQTYIINLYSFSSIFEKSKILTFGKRVSYPFPNFLLSRKKKYFSC